jgi:6-phospho-beta-glucosidase
MLRAAAEFLQVEPGRLFPEYYGLNHLGWLRALFLDGVDQVPRLLQALRERGGQFPHLPFSLELIEALGCIPNEYLYFYYYPRQSVDNLLKAGQSRAQQILPFNLELYSDLRLIRDEAADPAKIDSLYARYLARRGGTYMTLETGSEVRDEPAAEADRIAQSAEGYSAVALELIEALTGRAAAPILNVPNRGALPGMSDDDVVEVTCHVNHGVVRPIAMGALPDHALGLMKSVKAYERLTIQAAVEGSYELALKALALHPLVPSFETARAILDDYRLQHAAYLAYLK